MAENKIVGRADCYRCGSVVDVKLNKNGNAYWFCGCGLAARYSKQATNQDFGKLINGENNGPQNTVTEPHAKTGAASGGSAGESEPGAGKSAFKLFG